MGQRDNAEHQIARGFPRGVVDGLGVARVDLTKAESRHVRPTRGFDRDCFGVALILGGTVAGGLIAAEETLGGSLAAAAVVAGSELNALNSCFGK